MGVRDRAGERVGIGCLGAAIVVMSSIEAPELISKFSLVPVLARLSSSAKVDDTYANRQQHRSPS
jgi:hypothetical protein